MQDEAPCRPEPAPAPRLRRRRLTRPLLLVVLPALAGFVGLYWYAMSGRYVSTENAYVKADMVAISPDIDGRVVAVEVVENQFVRKGDVLFRLDPEPFQIALDIAEAQLLAVRNDIEASRAEFGQIKAEIAEAGERVRFFEQQAERQRELQGAASRARCASRRPRSSFSRPGNGWRPTREAAHRARGSGRRSGQPRRAASSLPPS